MHRIFGTEEDKVNCSFYFKIGACRHGERCSRLHMKPNFSQTLLLAHFYMPPYSPNVASKQINKMDINNNNNNDENANENDADNEHYEEFYEDVLNEFIKYGDVEELVICENLGDHMFGNTYVKFSTEEQAEKALNDLRGRYYAGRIIQVEYSPVTDFREGRCRQFDEHNCLRGGYCNFLHLKQIPKFSRHYLRRARVRSRYLYDSRRSRRHRNNRSRNRSHNKDDKNKESDSEEEWPSFPMRGSSEERRRCIVKWNTLLGDRKEKMKKKQESGMQSLPLVPPQTLNDQNQNTKYDSFVNSERLKMITN